MMDSRLAKYSYLRGVGVLRLSDEMHKKWRRRDHSTLPKPQWTLDHLLQKLREVAKAMLVVLGYVN